MAIERRHYIRYPVEQPARLRPHERFVVQVDVVDFSPQGFRARCDAVLLVGSLVSLDVPGVGSVDARIVWRDNGEIGAKFVQPIGLEHCAWTNPAVAEGLVAEAEAAAELARRLAERVNRSIPQADPAQDRDCKPSESAKGLAIET
ncbi:PilZ domain-containing protein [Sphingosinicella rhizophila]|uniref:PilZ domain-containing protein n=1 Tax=Sphingosinicella rhizophila TaxID=3050082 RepID=A0ABU3QA71_9SPHN|nr:PilZ domain-containing protein [Sphingosinicella sp. GR2756]MDT9600303.1 PilZ domain-containing protein [Sphingosinicella sp. GR2756]